MLLELGFISAMVFIALLVMGSVYCLRQMQRAKKQLIAAADQLIKERQKQQKLLENLSELQNKISTSALVDELTGLPSRKVFEDRLVLALNQSTRYKLTCSVMFLDLDEFKIINDALGYDAGDELLKEAGARLNTCVRQVDTIARFGGDEFVFIFTQIAKAETAVYIAQRLLDAISQPFQVQGQDIYITASVGIAVFPIDGQDAKTLLKNADNALHQAKVRGRNIYQFYREDMHTRSRRDLLLSSSLRGESIYQNFHLYYQPQVNLETKKIVCMEAILQWNHPDFGAISFEEFGKLAENSGMIVEIGEWLLKNACENLLEWREHQFSPNAIWLPLSLRQLENTHFIQKISTILQSYKLDPQCLIFEMTEPSLSVKIEVIEKVLYMMKHLGVRLAINHFGVGNLPLQSLRRLPIDIFKIDRELVKDMTVNKESEAIIKMIIALATSLQAKVVADGVESNKQKSRLLELGCDVMQGQLFGVPALAEDYTDKKIQSIHENV